MKIKVELVPMGTPNFIMQKMSAGQKQDGFKESPKFALSELDEETLAGLCDEFRAEIFQKAGQIDPVG